MSKLKSERHHWWPECVSQHWENQEGNVCWMRPDETVRQAPPKNFGVIGNGHHIKLSDDPSVPTPWDESFEGAFQSADGNFPKLIDWLNRLERAPAIFEQPLHSRILNHSVTDDQFSQLIECIVSLAVRSPMHRHSAVRVVEHFGLKIDPKRQNAIIGLNIRHSLINALRQIGGRGKAMVVFSPEKEFIFGDGFFNNLIPPVDYLLSPKLFVPLTPRLAVLFARPSSYMIEPRLVTLVVSEAEAKDLNSAVQVYAKDAIYYRSERPVAADEFKQAKHLAYADRRNPIDQLITHIPGISSV